MFVIVFLCNGCLGEWTVSTDIILEEDHPKIFALKFGPITVSSSTENVQWFSIVNQSEALVVIQKQVWNRTIQALLHPSLVQLNLRNKLFNNTHLHC